MQNLPLHLRIPSGLAPKRQQEFEVKQQALEEGLGAYWCEELQQWIEDR